MTNKYQKYIEYIAEDIFTKTQRSEYECDDHSAQIIFPFTRIKCGLLWFGNYDLMKNQIDNKWDIKRFLYHIEHHYGATENEAKPIWEVLSSLVVSRYEELPLEPPLPF